MLRLQESCLGLYDVTSSCDAVSSEMLAVVCGGVAQFSASGEFSTMEDCGVIGGVAIWII